MNLIFKNKTSLILILSLLILVSARQWRLADPLVMQAVRNLAFDRYQQLKPREPTQFPIRIVDVDEASILANGQWPWPRSKLATIVDKVTAAGAAVIAFDIVFSEPDRTSPQALLETDAFGRENLSADVRQALMKLPDHDEVFAKSLANSRAVLAFFGTNGKPVNTVTQHAGYSFLGEDPKSILPTLPGTIANLPVISQSAAGMGAASLNQGIRDDVIRKVPMFFKTGDEIFPNLGLEALRSALQVPSYILKTSSASGEINAGETALTHAKVGDYIFPLTGNGNLQIYYSRHDQSRYISAQEVLSSEIGDLVEKFEGHIVFLGTSAVGLEDIRSNALGETVPGVSVHAQIVDQILDGKFLNRPDWATGAEIAMMMITTAIIVIVLPFAGALISSMVGGLLALSMLAISWFSFSWYGLLIDPIFPMLTGAGTFLIATLLMYALTEREKLFIRSAFQQYLAPDLIQKLEKNPEMLKLGGEIRNMTIMFMDIRGFTPISEKLSPEELVTFLNQLLSPLTEIILKHEGAIDKYIGDSIMAFWNAPLDVADHPSKAALAALEMLEKTASMNAEDAFGFKSGNKGLDDIKIGIGISTGNGCVGNLGSTKRFDYSVVGDTVNVAARVESSCKAVGWPILLSQATAAECQNMALLEAGAISLKGKSKPEDLFALIGDKQFADSDQFRILKTHHDELLQAINERAKKSKISKLKAGYTAFADERMQSFIDNLGKA